MMLVGESQVASADMRAAALALEPSCPRAKKQFCLRPSRPGQTKAVEALGEQTDLVCRQENQNRE